MKKDVAHRISYYVKKVEQMGAVHPAKKRPRSHTYRHQRLMQYKEAMHKLINSHQERVSAALKGE